MATTVGQRIRQRRLELSLTQRELACDGLTHAYISRLEADGRRASIRALRKLARRLDVTVHWLETGEHDPAEELARLVIKHAKGPLPPRAATLARKILRNLDR